MHSSINLNRLRMYLYRQALLLDNKIQWKCSKSRERLQQGPLPRRFLERRPNQMGLPKIKIVPISWIISLPMRSRMRPLDLWTAIFSSLRSPRSVRARESWRIILFKSRFSVKYLTSTIPLPNHPVVDKPPSTNSSLQISTLKY